MKKAYIKFDDPEGFYSITLPAEWKYVEEKDRESLNQFSISSGCFFQISSNAITETIEKLIEANGLIEHDFNLPNISFVEKFSVDKFGLEVYHWMALLDGRFYFAAYFDKLKDNQQRDPELKLVSVRLALQNIIIHSKINNIKCLDMNTIEEPDLDYGDIINWRKRVTKPFFKKLDNKERLGGENSKKGALNIDVVQLYALLIAKISHQPNGEFNLVKTKKPLDNIIWWDFVLECDKGYIMVYRTPSLVEYSLQFDGDFDIESFFSSNIERYKEDVDKVISTFDKHVVYMNHYKSYHDCVESLWKDISKIDITAPESLAGHVVELGEIEDYTDDLKEFHENSVKYHVLAKALVLNAAFKIESFLNLIIRIGSKRDLKMFPDVLQRYFKQDFSYRVKNVRFYTGIFSRDIDMAGAVFKKTKDLMTLRNKYVHYEEDGKINKIDEVLYDRDYPLFQVDANRPAVSAIIRTYHHPSKDIVTQAYETANEFVEMVISSVDQDLRHDILYLLKQNPISYNERKALYSSVHMPVSLDFFVC